MWWLKPICLPLPALLLQDGRSGTIGTRGTGGEEKGYDDSSDESEILSSDDDENVETVRACAVRRNSRLVSGLTMCLFCVCLCTAGPQ